MWQDPLSEQRQGHVTLNKACDPPPGPRNQRTTNRRTGRLELHELRYDAPSAPPALRAALGDVLGATPGASGAAAGLRLMLQEEAPEIR